MKSILRFEETFTANLAPAQIPYGDISKMSLVFRGLQAGATQAELDAVMSQIDEIGISDTDDVMKGASIDGMDLVAISSMVVGATPITVESGGDNEQFITGNIVIPLNLKGLSEGVTPRYYLNFTDNAKTDNEDLTVGITHGVKIGQRYTYIKKTDTGSTTGTSLDIKAKQGQMKALLVKLTNKPSTADLTTDVERLKLKVGETVLYDYALGEIGLGRATFNLDDHDYLGLGLATYRCLLFPQGLDPTALSVYTESDTDTGTIEYIAVLQG